MKADNAFSGEVSLLSGSDVQLGNGVQKNTVAGNGIRITSGRNLNINNQILNAGSGALSATAKQSLTLTNVSASSVKNTVIAAENGNAVLNGVTADSMRHMAVSSSKGAVLQNNRQNSRNSLTARGVLSMQSDRENTVNNSIMTGGSGKFKIQ